MIMGKIVIHVTDDSYLSIELASNPLRQAHVYSCPLCDPYVDRPTINVNNRPTFNSKVKQKVLKIP